MMMMTMVMNRCDLGGIYCMMASSELGAIFVTGAKDQYERHYYGYCCYYCCCFYLYKAHSELKWRAISITIYSITFYTLITQLHSYRYNNGTDISIHLGVGIDLIVLSPALSPSGSLVEANSSKMIADKQSKLVVVAAIWHFTSY